jgi:hypothetical protein
MSLLFLVVIVSVSINLLVNGQIFEDKQFIEKDKCTAIGVGSKAMKDGST